MGNEERFIINGITGEKITFLESFHETNGEYLKIKVDLPPKAEGPPLHFHTAFEEFFEVLEGELTITIEEEEKGYNKGDSLHVPTKVNHRFRNLSDKPVSFYVTLTPGQYFEESMRIAYGLIDDNKINKDGTPKSLVHTALILKMQDTNITTMPKIVQTVLLGGHLNWGHGLVCKNP
ncbi:MULTISPECIES: cupin domain-containing protein [Bacillaceae]|uniref:Cupin domain-containing protein n=1 Tax=Evansella alkalicola TaxID=745819 RepID=A0ABS6JN88_9BACI|nr:MULTISPECIES: cupin domain-containing protein [Bacillaceae]MBU9720024.1 cupin domain-containing protein [Bacillus alkalicola]